MNALTNGTPICLIQNSEVKWEIEYEIYPIQLKHALPIADLITNDAFFEDIDVNLVSHAGRVTSIVLKAERYWFDLAAMSNMIEHRLDELIESYLFDNGGYVVIQA
jgi:hypothetical protein